MACQAQIVREFAAERPPVSPRVRAFGPVGAAMDDGGGIEQLAAVSQES